MDITAYEARRASTLFAYILWFVLGSLGAHRFYVRENRSALLLLGIHVAGWIAVGAAWMRSAGPVRTTTVMPGFSSTTVSWSYMQNSPLATIGAVLLTIVGIWVFVDLFLTYGLVHRYNRRLAQQVG